mgnify:CR=1 FL=1
MVEKSADLRRGGVYRFLEELGMLYHTGFLPNSLNGCHMFKRRYAALLPALILLSACSSKPKTEAAQPTAGAPSGGFLLEPQHNMMQMEVILFLSLSIFLFAL